MYIPHFNKCLQHWCTSICYGKRFVQSFATSVHLRHCTLPVLMAECVFRTWSPAVKPQPMFLWTVWFINSSLWRNSTLKAFSLQTDRSSIFSWLASTVIKMRLAALWIIYYILSLFQNVWLWWSFEIITCHTVWDDPNKIFEESCETTCCQCPTTWWRSSPHSLPKNTLMMCELGCDCKMGLKPIQPNLR